MKDGGKRHFCLEGIESIPKHKHARVDEPMEMKPLRLSSKRQKVMDKIQSSGSEAKRLAEVQKALGSYVNKEEDEVDRSEHLLPEDSFLSEPLFFKLNLALTECIKCVGVSSM